MDDEDRAAVIAVEAHLDRAALRGGSDLPALDGVVWLCVCDTMIDCPTWVVTDGQTRGSIRWQRLPERVERTGLLRRRRPVLIDVEDIADTSRPTYGDHVSPLEVRHWLEHPEDPPAPDPESGDPEVLRRFLAICASA